VVDFGRWREEIENIFTGVWPRSNELDEREEHEAVFLTPFSIIQSKEKSIARAVRYDGK